jgi:hypothetical protein
MNDTLWTAADAIERNGDLTAAGDPQALAVWDGQVRGGEGLPRESRRAWLRARIARLNEELRLVRGTHREGQFTVAWAQKAARRERAEWVNRLLAERRVLERDLAWLTRRREG